MPPTTPAPTSCRHPGPPFGLRHLAAEATASRRTARRRWKIDDRGTRPRIVTSDTSTEWSPSIRWAGPPVNDMVLRLPLAREAAIPLLAAAVMTVLALAGSWPGTGSGDPDPSTETRYAPGFCHTSYDLDGFPSTICDPGTIIPGAAPSGGSGESSPTGFVLLAVASWAIAGAGVVRIIRPLLLAAPVPLAVGILMADASGGAGRVFAGMAAGLLLLAAILHRPPTRPLLTTF